MSEVPKKRRRTRGTGAIWRKNRLWWIAYNGPDGLRKRESSNSERKSDAVELLNRRIGARVHGLPVIAKAEQLTFAEASKAVLNDFDVNKKRSAVMVRRRLAKHLLPYFGLRRMAGITAADVLQYVAHRKAQGVVAVRGKRTGDRVADVKNSTINRELQLLRRVFNLAIAHGRLAMKPKISLLAEPPARAGFFDREQVATVCAHLPAPLRDIVEFAFITGWRLHSEVLPLEWRQVNFSAGEVRLDAGATKNGKARTFPMTKELRRLLEDRRREHEQLKRDGHITPLVFFRMVAKGRGGEKEPRRVKQFGKAWHAACVAAGCPGRIPHDLRRSAVRTFVRAGIGQTIAMALSGHLTANVFRRYDIVSETDLREAAGRLDGFRESAATEAARAR